MTVIYPYLDIITSEYPNVIVSSPGLGYVYEDLILENGDPIPSEAELQAAYLTMLKRCRNEEINQQRDLKKTQGFWLGGNIYDCDDLAKANITGAVTAILMGQVLPANFTWRTKSNTSVPMNADQVKGLGLAMMSYTTIVFQWSWNLKNFLLSQTSVEAILGLDVTSNWPTNNYDGTGPGISTMQSIGQMMQAMAPLPEA